jgi:hypothetical protein
MKKGAIIRNWLIFFFVALFAVSFVTGAYGEYGDFSSGPGYNTALPLVPVPQGYPPLPSVARYLGELKGSWHDIGQQYGGRAGDLIALVFNGWYGYEVSTKMSWSEIKCRIQKYEVALKWYSPELLEICQGMADGAASYLQGSPYYAASGLTPYEMILAINLYFEINSYSPLSPECKAQLEAPVNSSGPSEGEGAGCSAIALLPKATAGRKVIHISSKDQSFWPQCNGVWYTMEYIGKKGPSGKAYKLFRAGTAGELAGMNVVNEKGVTITGHAGGNKGVRTNPFYPDYTFGIPAQFAIAQAGFFSKNLNKAVDNLVHGSDYYRQNMGRKTVQWARSFNMSLSDPESACVVEENPYRYAVRYPGYLNEVGKAYIVQTNHNSCKFSYDGETDRLTNIPMTQFGDGSSSTSASGLDGSGTRFWTLMWLAKNNFGKIDENWAMREFWTRDYYFWEDGFKDTNVVGVTTVANKAGAKSGQINTQCSVPSEHKNYWTVGTPPDWVGPWDSWIIEEKFDRE